MWPAFYKSKRYELNIIELFIQPQTAMAKSLSKTTILIDFAKKTPLPLVIHVSKTNIESTQYPNINDYYDSLMAKDF
jgi:hypothetical protein